jgi:hypothetical protein
MVVILGMAAMAIDVGMFLQERRDLQNAADAAALAAAQELPFSPADAVSDATTWAENNGIGSGELEGVTVTTTYQTDDTVTVQVKRDVPWLFARVLGRGSDTIRADASARVGSPETASNVMPFSLLEDDKEALEAMYGDTVVVKVSAGGQVSPGNFSLLDFGVPGKTDLRESITDGGDVTIGGLQDVLTGGSIGHVRSALADRLALTSEACDTFEEVFQVDGDAWRFTSNQCNPWEDEGALSGRVALVPVIPQFYQGSSQPVSVMAVALVFLVDPIGQICTGNDCDVSAIFLKAFEDFGSILGEYDPNSDVRFARLVE